MEASMTLKEKLKELIRDRLIYASGIKTGDLFDHTAELTVENIIAMLQPAELKAELRALLIKTFAQTVEYGAICSECCSSQGDGAKVLCEMADKPLKPDDYCPQQITCIESVLLEILAKCQTAIESYKQALEADASDLWRVTNAIKQEIAAREWIMEGRGCYAWDDDRYRDETRLVFEAVLKLISEVQHPAQLRFHRAMNKGNSTFPVI